MYKLNLNLNSKNVFFVFGLLLQTKTKTCLQWYVFEIKFVLDKKHTQFCLVRSWNIKRIREGIAHAKDKWLNTVWSAFWLDKQQEIDMASAAY